MSVLNTNCERDGIGEDDCLPSLLQTMFALQERQEKMEKSLNLVTKEGGG